MPRQRAPQSRRSAQPHRLADLRHQRLRGGGPSDPAADEPVQGGDRRHLPELDLGGGFGIAYTIDDSPATPADLAHGLSEIIEHECRAFGLDKPMLSLEPGRAISGPPGTALYTVGTIKDVDSAAGSPGATSASTAA
jgi:hypothetical protein